MSKVSSSIPGAESVTIASFDYLERIGSGAFGTVWKVQHKRTGDIFAMKTLAKQKLQAESLMKYAKAERNVMSYVRHPYIVPLSYAFQTEKQFVLVMRFCPGGNMQQLIKREGRLPENLSQHYAATVLLALAYIHELKVLFRDLKPENIIFDEDRHAMVTDFGLAKESVEIPAKSFLGSINYVAPEVLTQSGHSHTVDIYGLGVLVFNMLTGQPPFFDKNQQRMWTNIKEAPLVIPDFLSEAARSFIESTMDRTPRNRLGADNTEDVQGHGFFTGMDFEALRRRDVPVPQLPTRNLSKCSAGHELTPFRTTSPTFACDMCSRRQPEGAQMHACRECDYDLCESCRAGSAAAPLATVTCTTPTQQVVFGRAGFCARVFQCLEPPPDSEWDYVGTQSVLGPALAHAEA